MAAGIYHSFAVDNKGIVYGWGLNTFHQTGVAEHQDMIIAPTVVDALHPDKHNGSKVIKVSGGEHHSLFLFENGEVWGCGRCDANELGIAEDHPAFEGIKERREELQREREERVAEKQKKLDEALKKDKVDEEEKQKAEMELSEAQATLKVPPSGEYVPEPVRVSFSCSSFIYLFNRPCRYASRLSLKSTRSSPNFLHTKSPSPRITPLLIYLLV